MYVHMKMYDMLRMVVNDIVLSGFGCIALPTLILLLSTPKSTSLTKPLITQLLHR